MIFKFGDRCCFTIKHGLLQFGKVINVDGNELKVRGDDQLIYTGRSENFMRLTKDKTIKEVLEKYNLLDKTVKIEYRTYTPEYEDIFAGACKYKNGELISADGDNYSLDDVVFKYGKPTLNYDNTMSIVVWYESEWKKG